MRRDDTEFTAYLTARWAVLVRTLVLWGHPVPDARTIAFEALVRIQPDWRRLHREEDVEVAVWVEVLEERARWLRRADEDTVRDVEAGPAPPGPAEDGLVEQHERLEQVTAALRAMSADERATVVLGQVAELSEDQVADVLGGPVVGPVLADVDVRLALEAVPVEPLLAAEVVDEVRARRRRLLRRTTAGVAALLVVVAGVGWFLQREEGSTGEVRQAENPLPMAWYADGRLHLDGLTVAVPPVVDLVSVPDGVVMADERGAVVMADAQGELTTLGSTVPGEGLVVEPDNGWVAWADPGTGDPELVVHDTRVGEEVGRRSLGSGGEPVAGSGPIAIDDERVYYSARGNDYVWEPLPGTAFAVSGRLADTANGARMSRYEDGYLLQAAPFRSGNYVTGVAGRLTTDGRYAFVVEGEELVVHDVQEGRAVGRMYSPSDRAVAWTYSGGSFYIAVLHKLQDKTYQDMLQMPSEGNYRIFECVPGRTDACIERAEVREDAPEPPVLAR